MDWLNQIWAEIDKFFQSLEGLSKQQQDIIAVSTIVVGALFCFLGYKGFKYLLGLGGFLVGGVIGMASFYYIPWVNTTGEIGQFVLAAVFGAAGALIAYFLFYYFGVFVFGAVSCMWLAMMFLPKFGVLGDYRILFILGCGFIGGLLAFLMRRIIVIFCTAAIGSMGVIAGVGHFYFWPISVTNLSISQTFQYSIFDTVLNHSDGVVIISLLVFFFVAGVIIQSLMKDKHKDHKEKH